MTKDIKFKGLRITSKYWIFRYEIDGELIIVDVDTITKALRYFTKVGGTWVQPSNLERVRGLLSSQEVLMCLPMKDAARLINSIMKGGIYNMSVTYVYSEVLKGGNKARFWYEFEGGRVALQLDFKKNEESYVDGNGVVITEADRLSKLQTLLPLKKCVKDTSAMDLYDIAKASEQVDIKG